MHEFLQKLLEDRKGGEIFRLFTPWHFFYIGLTAAVIVAVFLLTAKKGADARRKAAGFFGDLAFGLYMADFFLMPLAYGEIDIEKLPFHVCTAMCLACFLCRHVKKLESWRIHVTLLGFLSNLVYLIYPAGVMWHQVHPLTYRVIQTLVFHSAMTIYGFLALGADGGELKFRTCHKDLIVLIAMTLWAILGNLCYNGAYGEKTYVFNWFFVTADPFGLFDPSLAPFVMPFLNIVLFFGAELLVLFVLQLLFRGKEVRRSAKG